MAESTEPPPPPPVPQTPTITVHSPRSPSTPPPIPSRTPPPRNSSSARTTPTTSPSRPSTTATRRNKSALRSFYNLHGSSPLDSPSFSAQPYLTSVLSTYSIPALLNLENQLIAEIRTLDGDKKALVYDNYSKLIDATETMGRMRGQTAGVGGAAAAIGLIEGVEKGVLAVGAGRDGEGSGERGGGSERGRSVVTWALGAPQRIKKYREEGREEEAKRWWERLEGVCKKWEGVEGVEELRERGKEAVGVPLPAGPDHDAEVEKQG